MPKSRIIIDAVNGDVPIATSLKRLLVLAHDVHNYELQQWAENELTGYGADSEVPEYRKTVSLNFTYSGINSYRFQATNVPLSISFLDTDTLESISKVVIRDGIDSIASLAEAESAIHIDRSFLAGEVEKKSQGGVQCFSISQNLPASFYKGIIAEVSNRLIKALMLLEDQYGDLNQLGVEVTPSEAATSNASINNVVLNLPEGAADKETAASKVTGRWIAPIVTGIVAAVVGALIIYSLGLS